MPSFVTARERRRDPDNVYSHLHFPSVGEAAVM